MTAGHRDVVEPQLERTGLGRPARRPRLRRRPAGPQARPGAAPAGARPARPGRSARRASPTSATRRPTCGWPARSARGRSASSRSLGDPDELRGGRARTRSRRRSPPGSTASSRAPGRPRRAGGDRDADRGARHALDPRRRRRRRAARRSTRPGRAGPTASTSSSRPTAARVTPPRLGLPIDLLGRRRRFDRPGGPRPSCAARGRPDRARAGRQGRVGHRARDPRGDRSRRATRSRSSARSAARGSTTRSANVWLLAHPGAGGPRRPCSSTARPRIRLVGAGAGRRAGRRALPVGSATSSRSSRSAATRSGRDDDGLRYPLARRAAAGSARRAACRTSGRRRDASVVVGRGRLLVVETPATLSAMSMPEPSATRRPRSPSPTRPARSIAWPTSAAAGRSSTSTRRTTRPAARSRRASSATPTRRSTSAAPTSGASARRARASKRAFREKFGLPFTLLADEDHEVADAYGSWVEKKNYGKTYMGHRPVDLPRRPRRPDRPDLAEGQAGGPRGRGPRGARRGPGGAAPADRPRREPRGHRRRLRSWGETSEASAGMIAPIARPAQRRGPQVGTRSGERRRSPRLAAGPVHGHRRPPRRRRLRAGRDRGPLDRRGLGRLARLLHERRRGRRGSGRRSAGARRPARARAARRRRRSSATPASSFLHQPDGALDNDLALREQLVREIRTFRPDAVLATDPTVVFYRDGGVNHTDHRAAGHGRGRRRLSGGAQPDGVPVARPRRAWRPTRSAGCTSSGRTSRTSGSTCTTTIERKIDALAAHASQIKEPAKLDGADPGVGRRGGRADRGGGRPRRSGSSSSTTTRTRARRRPGGATATATSG